MMTALLVKSWKCLLFASLAGCIAMACPARATTERDADMIFSAYNAAFCFTNASGAFYRADSEGGKTPFWDRAEQAEMILDVYERSANPACLTLFSNVVRGFVADYGANWSDNPFNDDIMWMVIACARGAEYVGDGNLRAMAKGNFDLCYARAWSADLGGGLWWKTSNLSKNACVNGPASIAAFLLFRMSGDPTYLEKAEHIYQWERSVLFDPATGQVYDNISLSGKLQRISFTYNEGTFIGAANFLGCTNDARMAADYVKHVSCRAGLLPQYGPAGDSAGFNGICVRWLARFMNERGMRSSYLDWLKANADAAWMHRRTADNLSWPRWREQTPSGSLDSWGCSSSVVLLQVVQTSRINHGYAGLTGGFTGGKW